MQTPAQLEAYLNEYKGNLFEFLVAQKIAKHFNLEKKFYADLPPQYLKKLQTYESELRKLDDVLYKKLPELAEQTLSSIIASFDPAVQKVELLGKISNNKQSEHDILVTGSGRYPLSLKFCKSDSYVNTKNGGARSFLEQYFSAFNPTAAQAEFNLYVEQQFTIMMHEVHESVGLTYLGNNQQWIQNGYTELPGELENDQKEILSKYYYRLSTKLYEILSSFYTRDREAFFDSIRALLGYSSQDLIQVMCFYKNSTAQRYDFQKIRTESWKKYLTSTDGWKICEHKADVGNFEIDLISSRLQLRIKPMNKFTAPSVKINCSVKYL
ncbi:MAG: hypothetical protein JNM93_05910 [Bacteriovoracaceae bacterium]|nr:hypothetical protein [Bacteriovoracaceae bacterium]